MMNPHSHCPFCGHGNPRGSRFCNECGSPLHLKPCPGCDAVNDAAAALCFQCGAALDSSPATERELEAVVPAFASNAARGGVERPERVLEAILERLEFRATRGEVVDTRGLPENAGGRPTLSLETPSKPPPIPSRTDRHSRWVALSLAFAAVGGYAAYRYATSTVAPPMADPLPAAKQGADPAMSLERSGSELGAPASESAPPSTTATPAADAAAEAPASPAHEPAASPGSEPVAAPSSKQSPRAAATETDRIILRESGPVTSGTGARAAAARARSAAETNRIIQREMGHVLPPRGP